MYLFFNIRFCNYLQCSYDVHLKNAPSINKQISMTIPQTIHIKVVNYFVICGSNIFIYFNLVFFFFF